MADDDQTVSEYTVKINNIDHVMLLSEEDAKRYGDLATKNKKSVLSKVRQPANKSGE